MSHARGTAPPLHVWWLALALVAIALLAVGSLHLLGLAPGRTASPETFNLARFSNVPAAATHVVVIGSSKTLWAVEFDEVFSKRLAPGNAPVVFHRVTAGNPTADDFRAVLERLRHAPPDILLFESDLLLIDKGDKFGWYGWREQLRRNIRALRNLHRNGSEPVQDENWGMAALPSLSRCEERKSPEGMRVYSSGTRRWRVVEEREITDFLDALRPLREAGTRVGLLDVPRSPSARAAVASDLQQASAHLLQRTVDRQSLLYRAPVAIPDAMYCDQLHMNAEGRARYSQWLATALQAWLEPVHE